MNAVRLAHRILGRTARISRQTNDHVAARLFPTYAVAERSPAVNARFGFLDQEFMQRLAEISPWHPGLIGRLAEMALQHRFDLLGSGPVTVFRGMECRGVEGIVFDPVPSPSPDSDGQWLSQVVNRSNLAEARRTWRCISDDYRPIDWQIDFKSGYRWSEKTWHANIRFGDIRGADVKVPWELARMQHLPLLALAAHYAGAGYLPGRPEVFAAEACNQMLDFIATNPPGFGVNWACAMDVAIRAANMIIARDMLVATGDELDGEFESIFAGSVLAHARHIARNLEWSPVFRGNHYLADLAGLLFSAVFLPSNAETDRWLSFAVAELQVELGYQFHPDGSNFEASVCYHRLSSEIVLWTLALLENLPEGKRGALGRPGRWPGPLPPPRSLEPSAAQPSAADGWRPVGQWCRDRLYGMSTFTRSVTRPDGLVAQFGDNDSGRFVILGPVEHFEAGGDPASPEWSLNHQSLIAGIDAYLGHGSSDAASLILAAFAGSPNYAVPTRRVPVSTDLGIGDHETWQHLYSMSQKAQEGSVWRTAYPADCNIRRDMKPGGSHAVGLLVLKSPGMFLAVRCGALGIHGLGAHDHCDQLAIELVLNGRTYARDPGSRNYTAFADVRNAYRSVRAHHAPRHLDKEPANLSLGAFDLRGGAVGECLYFGDQGFVGRHRGYGFDIYRLIQVCEESVVVIDFSPDGHAVSDPRPDNIEFSAGYGL
jgi:hypothetical protein